MATDASTTPGKRGSSARTGFLIGLGVGIGVYIVLDLFTALGWITLPADPTLALIVRFGLILIVGMLFIALLQLRKRRKMASSPSSEETSDREG